MVNTHQSVFLFTGNDGYSKEKAMLELSSLLLKGGSRQLDYKVLYGDETDAGEIVGHAATAPFSSRKRVVVVRRFEKLSADDLARIAKYAKNPCESSCLILETSEVPDRGGFGDISRYANIRKFDCASDNEFDALAKKLLAENNKEIEEDALRDLRELKGRDILALSQELDKLAAFSGMRNIISAEDVGRLAGKSVEASSFDLGWAVARKDIDKSIGIVVELLSDGRRHQEIIGVLCWHLKMLAKAKELQANGLSDYQVSGALKMRKSYSDELCGQARSISTDRLISGMEILLEADLDIKRTRLDPDLILEFAVIRLCLI